MRTRHRDWILRGLLLWLGLATGCGQNAHVASSIELMNAERRALEDQLYDLEFEYEAAVAEVKQLQAENSQLRSRPDSPGFSRSPASRPSDARDDYPDLSPPLVEEGELTIPQIEIPEMEEGAALDAVDQHPVSTNHSKMDPVDPQITRLEIHPRLTRGIDLDAKPGDDGLEVVIEPRNAAGELVALPGPVTVVALDYALREQGQAARVARWDLTAEQVGRFLQDSPHGAGIRLQLLWPDDPPKHGRLRLDARYGTLDGRYLDARRDVTVHLRSRLSQRWTPRATANSAALLTRAAKTEEPSEGTPAENPDEQPRLARPEWSPYR